MSKLNILVKKSERSGLTFSKSCYYASVLESSTRSEVVLVVDALGSALNENLEFKLLNPSDMFTIGLTSGVNGDICYQLVRGNGERFRVGRKTGFINLRRKLDSFQ